MLKRNDFSYYDYAGGTYYTFKLCWFFNIHDVKENEELVFIKYGGDTFNWHMFWDKRARDSQIYIDLNGDPKPMTYPCGYHGEFPLTKELKDYCQDQRFWKNEKTGVGVN